MDGKISVIGDPDTVIGFGLAGIGDVREVKEEEIELFLEELSESMIIIITERIAEKIRSRIDEIESKKKGVTPIIIEVPDKSGKIVKEVDPLRELIRRAIGVEMK
jgi:V/A-type H+-transporting ATPase subunit F